MVSAQYTQMLTNPVFNIQTDIRPWGGISPTIPVDGAVLNISKNPGAGFDTASIVLYNANFGDETTPFIPISIEDDDTGVTFYRGFVVENIGDISDSGESQTVKLFCYKWLLSKRTQLRGKWYLNKGQFSAPAGGMGSGISAGDAKYTFERFRSDLQEESGYLQNQQMVFNQGGVPDCFIDNHASDTKVVFYMDKINYVATEGLPGTNFVSQDYNGYYWTWCTIIRHIYNYWIEPYNVVLASVNINANDLIDLSNIDATLNAPMNFSIEGYNPLTALDFVVSSIPGRWYWYIEYSSASVEIRIRELSTIVGAGTITLNTCSRGDKLVNSNANYTKATVRRNSSEAVANVIGLGGKLKLVTTVKAVPLWTRYDAGGGVYSDFSSVADFNKWRKWIMWQADADKFKKDASPMTWTKEELSRYATIYRLYGIAEEGGLFGERIVSDDPGAAIDVIDLTGDVGTKYTDFTVPLSGFDATFRNFFFENARIEREMSPPEFKRYSDKIQVFMFDDLFTRVPKDKAGTEKKKKTKTTAAVDQPTAAQKANQEKRKKWVIPDIDNIGYTLDEKNMTIYFDQPQCKKQSTFRDLEADKLLKTMNALTRATMASREVYVTATFSTDLASVFGSIISGGFVESNSGAPFSAYVNARNQEIIYHKNAFYPITVSYNRDVVAPTVSTDKLDGNEIADSIRKCDAFDDYREYIGEGHYELARAIINWKEGYQDYEEHVSVDMPYFTLDHAIGETLTAIGNTNYTDLASYLTGISWQRVGDSDSYTTSLALSNVYRTDKSNIDFAPLKHDENANRFNSRVKFKFFNQKTDGALPTL